MMTRMSLSYRDLLFCHAPALFPDTPLPALGTLVYRFQQRVERHADRYQAGLLALGERLGWCPVARVRDGVWQRVRSSSWLRARARGEQYPEVLRGRYRIEQVFGSVKSAYGSYVGSRSWWGAVLRV